MKAWGVFTRRAFAAALLVTPLAAKKRRKKRGEANRDETLGLIAGTVFTSDGLSLPGARVEARLVDDAEAKPVKGLSDPRGEFALRVPATTDGRRYRVRGEADGFTGVEKTADVYTGQKTMINLLLGKP